jgi:hypothetical protein
MAHDQLVDRLQHNLDMYHDIQKLRQKPVNEMTKQDLLFVKQQVCPDGKCEETGNGAEWITLGSVAFAAIALLLQ